MSFCSTNLYQTCRIATKLIKSVLFFSLKWKYFQRTTKNIFFSIYVRVYTGYFIVIYPFESGLNLTYLFLNFCNWYRKYKNSLKGWLFKIYRTTQHILVDSIDKYSFWIFTQQEQSNRTEPDFFIEISAWVFVESTTC